MDYQGRLFNEALELRARIGLSVAQPLDDQIELGSDLHFVKREYSSLASDNLLQLTWRALDGLEFVTGKEVTVDRQQLPANICILKETGDGGGGDTDTCSQRRGDMTLSNVGVFLQGSWRPAEPNLTFFSVSATTGIRCSRGS